MGAVSEFILRMNDQVSGNASLAARAMGQLESKIRSETDSLSGLNAKLDAASEKLAKLEKGGGKGSFSDQFDALQKQKKAVDGLKGSLAEKTGGIAALEGARPGLEMAQRSTETVGAKVGQMADAMQNANGVTGKLTAALKTLGPEGAAAAAVLTVVIGAVTALAVAFADLFVEIIQISQEKDALANTFAALSTGTASGRELVDTLSDVAASLPQAEGKVLAWGKSLMAAGLEGEKLEKAVRAVASSAALMGNDGGAAEGLIKRFQMMAETGGKVKLDRRIMSQLAESGVSAKTLADALGVDASKLSTMSIDAAKLGDALQDALVKKGTKALVTMGLTWDSIKGKLSDGIEDLFEDMGTAVQPFMAAVKDLFSEFLAGSTTMAGAKSVLTAVFAEVFAVATKLVNYLHMGFLYLEIGALKFAIALAPTARILKSIATNQTFLDGLVIVLKGLGIVALVVVAAMALFGGSILAIFAGIGLVTGAIWALVGAVLGGVVTAIGALNNAGPAIKFAIMQWADNAYAAAQNYINGIVNGIVEGYGLVIAAVKGLAHAAASAFTSFFKIQSPSLLMRQHGAQLPAGVALGVEDGTADVEAAVGDMSATGAGAAKGSAGASRGRGGDTFQFNLTVTSDVGDSTIAKIKTAMLEVFEQARGESPSAVTS